MKKVLIFGGSGMVGTHFIKRNSSNFTIKAPLAEQVDILNEDQVKKVVSDFNPDSVINFAAYTNVEEAEKQKDDKEQICYKVNVVGAKNIAKVVKEFDKHLIHISTEYIFDGTKEDFPYNEEDTPNPINWYGKTKFLAEQEVQECGASSVIARLSMPFCSKYELKKDIARFFLEQLKSGQKVTAVSNQRITPTLVNDIADSLKILLENESLGLYHISSRDSVTPLEFVKTLSEVFQLDYSLISEITLEEFNSKKTAKLLKYSWLNPVKFEKEFGDDILHTVEEGLTIFKQEIDFTHENN